MDKPNKELLQAFIDWFMREYSNFGGKPIAERYEEAFDTFNNDFIDARYDAFQDGWKAQQAKVDELQKRVDKAIRLLVEAELYQSEPNIDLAVKALKGDQYDEHRKKAEETISKGASLTNHRIEL
ncbi:hypothetical protein [Acinetobacter baumannii]|uniref:hypothetical protein n=1 Tax=Acinetobacter baumannii TaxID=470 RepID=UPI003B436829